MVIGVTGNSGSGKSEIARILAQRIDVDIIDADEVVRELSEPEQIYYKEIVKLFGTGILEDELICRPKLAQVIYSNVKMREKLNKLTYKYVVDEIKHRVKTSEKVIIDAPLLFESKLDKICNFTIGVVADKEAKIERICKRDRISKETAKARLSIQQNDTYYKTKADYIIYNNGELDKINLEEICTRIGMN